MTDFTKLTPDEVDELIARVQKTTGRSEEEIRETLVDILNENAAADADNADADAPVEPDAAAGDDAETVGENPAGAHDVLTEFIGSVGRVTRTAGEKITAVAGRARDVITDPEKQAELKENAARVAHTAGDKITGVAATVKEKLTTVTTDNAPEAPADGEPVQEPISDPVAEEPAEETKEAHTVDWAGVAAKITRGAGEVARSVNDTAHGFVDGYREYIGKPETKARINGIKEAFLAGYHAKDAEKTDDGDAPADGEEN